MTNEDFQACVAGAARVAAAYATERAGTPDDANAIVDLFASVLDAAIERAPVDDELDLDEEDEEGE
ncbi:MAG TPA: hypothetical protein VE591_07785 [Candidatus Acidoferrum sp.]|jgi:hypothetical protein|nr:hypothetical protein [Candidatus Acidoferrum sp.]